MYLYKGNFDTSRFKDLLQNMSLPLKQHIRKFVAITDAEFTEIMEYFSMEEVRKKTNMLVEGKICRYHYFVQEGCLRKFFINDKGLEQTTEFALENWWMTDHISYESNKPSEFYIQAVENSIICRMEFNAQELLLQKIPKMERYFRFIYQRAFAASQMRIKYLYSLSKEEMYQHFSAHYPDFVQRIPQNLLATFLGFTPEYLSELRKRRSS
ncbi:MAG TPA: Crp/Fnr family transcriptional regulator [Flavisolibacter sp.]|jgi:CRP-like cAMP-binding protein|nr:Crp/Fnr family transcriptional regulator [Flavisolibacter sp.]